MKYLPARSMALALVAGTLGLFSVGCGSQGASVSGRVVENGQPLKGGSDVTVTLQQLDGARGAFTASVGPDGSFTLPTPVPPGKYRVSLTARGDYGAAMARNPRAGLQQAAGGDRFRGAFQGDRSPLTADVAGSSSLTIDVAKKTVTQ